MRFVLFVFVFVQTLVGYSQGISKEQGSQILLTIDSDTLMIDKRGVVEVNVKIIRLDSSSRMFYQEKRKLFDRTQTIQQEESPLSFRVDYENSPNIDSSTLKDGKKIKIKIGRKIRYRLKYGFIIGSKVHGYPHIEKGPGKFSELLLIEDTTLIKLIVKVKRKNFLKGYSLIPTNLHIVYQVFNNNQVDIDEFEADNKEVLCYKTVSFAPYQVLKIFPRPYWDMKNVVIGKYISNTVVLKRLNEK
ncbi:MAG: hypothetical protein HRT71_13675 [Flavobacteriales bacterium]|nr:hypothetical protein [Flavobacteriales bacterium]